MLLDRLNCMVHRFSVAARCDGLADSTEFIGLQITEKKRINLRQKTARKE